MDVGAMLVPMLDRWLGVGLHPLFNGLVGAAAFSAIGRPTAARMVRCDIQVLPADPGPFFLPAGDWIAVGILVVLRVAVVIVIRRTR